MPFIGWELKPVFEESSKAESVLFSLSTDRVNVTLQIRSNEVSLYSVDTEFDYKPILEKNIGLFYKPEILIEILENVGIDIFPQHDAYLYFENEIVPKQWVCENHVYFCMALACNVYHFKHSVLNHEVDYKKIILQMKECLPCDYNVSFCSLIITLYRAVYFQSNDNVLDDDVYDEIIEKQEFHPDLYCLIQSTSSSITKAAMNSINLSLVDTVNFILQRTRVLSYSSIITIKNENILQEDIS